MGRVYLRTLSDCAEKGVILAVKCGSCERVVYVAPHSLIGLSAGRRGKIMGGAYLTEVEPLLLCRGGQGSVGCGAKNAEVRAVWPHEIPGVPKGVPAMLWLAADERERKRLVRKARG